MKIRFIKAFGLSVPGDVIDPEQVDVARLLIQRGIAVRVGVTDDPDGDGKAEGGQRGEKKAYSRPPARKPVFKRK